MVEREAPSPLEESGRTDRGPRGSGFSSSQQQQPPPPPMSLRGEEGQRKGIWRGLGLSRQKAPRASPAPGETPLPKKSRLST